MQNHVLKSAIVIVVLAFFMNNLFAQDNNTATNNIVVKVYYFHGNHRCNTCNTIESLSKTAVQNSFANEIQNGQVKWEVLNFEKKANKKYMKQFQLFSSSLIMVKYKDGKEIEWKSCEKIWEYVRNESDFIKYVQKEVKSYLGKS